MCVRRRSCAKSPPDHPPPSRDRHRRAAPPSVRRLEAPAAARVRAEQMCPPRKEAPAQRQEATFDRSTSWVAYHRKGLAIPCFGRDCHAEALRRRGDLAWLSDITNLT